MEGIINNHSVEQNLVLYGRSAADIKLPALVASKNYTRQYLKVLGKVGLPTNGWYLFDLAWRNFDNRSSGFGFAFNMGSTCNAYSFQRNG